MYGHAMSKGSTTTRVETIEWGLPKTIDGVIKTILGIKKLEHLYEETRKQPGNFFGNALDALEVRLDISCENFVEVKKLKGPVIVVGNHPFGAIDALALLKLTSEMRNDFRFVANSMLSVMPEFRSVLIPVDLTGTKSNSLANRAAVKTLLKYLGSGGLVGMFPAGRVANFPHWLAHDIQEHAWHKHLGRLIQLTKATVVPVYFEGRNSLAFQYIGLAVPRLQISLLAREILVHKGLIRMTVGKPISALEILNLKDASAVTAQLRDRTLKMKN